MTSVLGNEKLTPLSSTPYLVEIKLNTKFSYANNNVKYLVKINTIAVAF